MKKAEPNDPALFNDLLIMVEPVGFEPTTSWPEATCSPELSYSPNSHNKSPAKTMPTLGVGNIVFDFR